MMSEGRNTFSFSSNEYQMNGDETATVTHTMVKSLSSQYLYVGMNWTYLKNKVMTLKIKKW